MAGGKATPRQKMINMMYLVLTALLALNVSKETLLSFRVIADSLERSADNMQKKNAELGAAIKEAADTESKGGKDFTWIKKEVDEILSETNKISTEIQKHLEELKKPEVAGFDEETGMLAKIDETEKNYIYWMKQNGNDTDNNGRGAGAAKELRDKLTAYVNWANKKAKFYEVGDEKEKEKLPPRFMQIAEDPLKAGLVKKGAEGANKKWEYYIFHYSPAIANVAILQKLRNDVRNIEVALLELLKVRLSDIPFKIDSLVVVDAPDARIVPAGIPFTTKIYVTSSARGAKPKFSGSGNIKLDASGNSAEMSIPTTGRKGTVDYTYSAQVPMSSGTLKNLTGKAKFDIVEPGVEVVSDAVNQLYLQCQNPLTVNSPVLREFYKPRFSAVNAEVIPSGKNEKSIFLVPTALKKVKLTVNNFFNGQVMQLAQLEYNVVKPPRPAVRVQVDGKNYTGQPVSPRSVVIVQILPEPGFQRSQPADAKYTMTGFEVLTRKGLGGMEPVTSGGGGAMISVPLATMIQNPKKGQAVTISIKGINRINFQGNQIPETFLPNELIISLSLN
jgi:gliding motility-associated protein GldM